MTEKLRLPGCLSLLAAAVLFSPAGAQVPLDSTRADNLPVGMGQLSLSTVTLQLTNGNLEIRMIPLDERVLRLLTRDSYLSMERLLESERRGIDSVTSTNAVSSPGIAFVSFRGLAPNTRFDPQQLTLTFHGQPFRPVGWVAMSPTFGNQQLDTREQVQALVIFSRVIPVKEAFTLNYLAAVNDTWESRLPRFDTERSRILGTRTPTDTSAH